METQSENACFGGVQGVYTHASEVCRCDMRSEEHTSELQSPVPISYAVFCLKKKKNIINNLFCILIIIYTISVYSCRLFNTFP